MWRATTRKCTTSLRAQMAPKTSRFVQSRSVLPAVQSAFASSHPFTVTARSFSDTTMEKYEFQAETKKLLDIVTHSIYTDKEVFLRELISNASDSLEKFRFNQVTGKVVSNDDSPLQINISVDKEKNTITIYDNGIGMTKDELVSHLGTIARSGSKQFVENLKEAGASRDGDSIIGQFGVGFYSSFMVSDEVTVESVSATAMTTAVEEAIVVEEGEEVPPPAPPTADGYKWTSDGSGDFTVGGTTGSSRGSKITLHLKDTCTDYCDVKKIKDIIKKYSNFVAFPVLVDGIEVNTVSAIWAKDKNSVSKQEYNDFYKYVANAFDTPKYTLHFSADAPIDLKTLLFFPTLHTEKFGMGRMEPSVSLYSRKVLIESKPADLLPSWLRFMQGVVDSEDLPLSIAREKAQDTLLLNKIRDVLTRKIVRFLGERLKRDEEGYVEWYKEFHMFIKEGICMDPQYGDQLAKLLMFETSQTAEGDVCTLDEYIARCPPEQKNIYYMMAPDRKGAFSSPYYETFKAHDKEV
jgi:TNF receptor-associated protein 1